MTTTGDIRVRVSSQQKEQLKNLSEAQGHRTISDYVRSKVFDNDLAIHSKVNEILALLKQGNRPEVKENEQER